MKFKVKSKEDGYNVKRAIFDLERECQYLTLYFVKDQTVEHIPVPDDLDYVWDIHKLRESRKARVRYSKKEGAWYLYLPEPEYRVRNLRVSTSPEPVKSEDDIFLEKLYEMCIDVLEMMAAKNDGRRKCMIWKKSRKKDVEVEEWPCWFHCWSSNRIVKDDGAVVDKLLAVCEFQDGHVERINFDHIRFVEEWE